MHKICDLDDILTSDISNNTTETLKKFWQRHFFIDVIRDVAQKLSRKSSKLFNSLQLKYA